MTKEKINQIYQEFRSKLSSVQENKKIEQLKIDFLGKKGKITHFLKNIGTLAEENRREVGKFINEIKTKSEQAINEKFQDLKKGIFEREKIDIHLTGKKNQIGQTHPLIGVRDEVLRFFNQMGFVTVAGPEIETDYYNFQALNMAEGHPARDGQDSFYLKGNHLLRTQTSPMQIRVMEENQPPLAIVSPGRVFRRDTLDATHSFCFHQVEGLLLDKEVNFCHLKAVLTSFCRKFFGKELKIRFRPDYFPFTEPSCEIAIQYPERNDGWLEILGAGMINPLVLQNCGLDYKKYSGFAFGLGLERIAMLIYDIKDIRLFYENNFSFLKQF